MESIKISLADAAQKLGDSVDYLLAQAEAEQLDVFARLQPFTAKMGTYPHKTDIYDNQTRSTATHEYTALLPAQIQALRAGRQIEIKVIRPEGFENGYSIPSLSEEPLLYWLDNPQQIGIESIFLNWRDEPKQTAPAITQHKQRINTLDAPITKAIERANSTSTADVFLQLREMALGNVLPFTGAIENGALFYTNDDGNISALSKAALGKRLARKKSH